MSRLVMIGLAWVLMTWCLGFMPRMAFADGDEPPIFDKRPYVDAKKAAEDAKKWFIVKATASWCMPCKRMDKTTWRDDKVVKWLTDNAVVVALDVDAQKKIAMDLGIEAMPTMVAFKDGKEFDRVQGYQDPAAFLVWLEGIAKGEKSIEAVRKRAGSREAGDKKVDIEARMDLARSLQSSGKKDEAADEYVWLWQHMLEHNPAYYGVRLSYLVSDMQRLASTSESAKKKFTALRDETAKGLDGEKVEMDTLVDFVGLNKAIGDDAATLAWYDKVKDQPRYAKLVDRVSRNLSEIFIAKGRWADLGKMYPDPIAELQREHDFMVMLPKHDPPPEMDEATKKMIDEMPAKMFREKIGQMYAGLLAAGREEDAAKLAAKARELDAKPEMSRDLVSWALKAKQARKGQLAWLTDEGSSDLKARVEAALKEQDQK
jgi:thioredoxin 1